MARCIAKSLCSTITLNDGVVMPLFGLGVWQCKSGGEAEKAVEYALNNHYKMIDTATLYKNEEDVGHALRKSGLKRDDFFVVTKLWDADHGYEETKKAIKLSLEKLSLEYVDLYLMHSPNKGKVVESYQAMVELKQQGLTRSIGVSNFGVHHLEGLKNAGKPLPSVNQIELHPWQQKQDIVKYCHENGITLMGYSPLARGKKMDNPKVAEIAKKYGKSYTQVLIRWSVQNGYITIPKSIKEERIIANAEVFDWELSSDDMATLNAFPQCSVGWNPTVNPWEG